jgi:hypothetical protein
MFWLSLAQGCAEAPKEPETEEPETGRLLALYADADGDSFGDAASLTLVGDAAEGWVADATDCDDTNADVHPGAVEVCNEVDENCDGSIDEGAQVTAYADADLDGWGDPDSSAQMCTVVAGWAYNRGDCDDANADRHPGVGEVCDGVVDDGVQHVFYADRDGDGYGDRGVEELACAASAGWVDNRADCDPSVSHDDGSCLDWAPPAADFERTLSVDVDAKAVWAGGEGGSWELTQYRYWDGGDSMYYVIGTDTVVIPESVYHPNTDPYCYYHCWGWTEVYYNYYTGWLVFQAALP